MENENNILDIITEKEKQLIYKQVISEINRKYRQEKKEQIKERYHKDIPCCICGKMIDYTNMGKHRRTKKCLKIKKELENNKTQSDEDTENENNQSFNVINNKSDEDTENDCSSEYVSN